MKSAWPKHGEIYLTALDPALGNEIHKTRTALVIQNDISNEYSATTIVAAKTTFSVHVLLAANATTGLSPISAALLSQFGRLIAGGS